MTNVRAEATRVDARDEPIRASPSGLLTQYLAWKATGGTGLFVARQWLGTGQQVYRHTHAVEEVLLFLEGNGTASLGDDEVAVGPGITLIVPAGVVHGFRNEAEETLLVLVIFPGDAFAQTFFVEPTPDQRHLQPSIDGLVGSSTQLTSIAAPGEEPTSDRRGQGAPTVAGTQGANGIDETQ